jgi:ABC-type nitrate/sulfonate/bicarbonate transport system ATPase subunit
MHLVAYKVTFRKEGKVILHNVSFSVAADRLIAIVGGSGSGKSTLLKILTGLEKATKGSVVRPDKISYIAQDAKLLPWLTVKENILLPQKIKRLPKEGLEEVWRKSQELIDVLHIQKLGDQKPQILSGGMAQRVLLAQALINEPTLLLLDEALTAVDQKHKYEIVTWLRKYSKNKGISVILVTHDLQEALTFADRVLPLNKEGSMGAPYYIKSSDRFTALDLTETQTLLWKTL